MIVCVCNRVSDREIAALAHEGCTSFDVVQMETGAATCCGCCEACARQVFEDARQEAEQRASGAARTIAIALTA